MWGWAFAILAVIWFVVRWGGRDVRYIGRNIGMALNIKPHLIEQMAMKMGQERSSMLAKQLRSFPNEATQAAVTTAFIYQVSVNRHPENVKWWRQRVIDSGFDPRLTFENVEIAFMYLRSVGEEFEVSAARVFLSSYTSQFGNE